MITGAHECAIAIIGGMKRNKGPELTNIGGVLLDFGGNVDRPG